MSLGALVDRRTRLTRPGGPVNLGWRDCQEAGPAPARSGAGQVTAKGCYSGHTSGVKMWSNTGEDSEGGLLGTSRLRPRA